MSKKFLTWGGAALGVFLVWLAGILVAGAVVQHQVPVSLSTSTVIRAVGDAYVVASGTWVMEGEAHAFPLQTTEIRCERELRRCSSGTAMVMLGNQLTVDVTFHEIVSWEKSRVVFVDDSPQCVQYVYTIDLASKAANGIRRKRGRDALAPECSSVLNEELKLSLKSGFPEVQKLQESAMPWFGKMMLAPLRMFL
jgi:hypothetical protein